MKAEGSSWSSADLETLVSVRIVEIILPRCETLTVRILREGGIIHHLCIFTVLAQILTLTINWRLGLVMVGTFLVKPLVHHHLSKLTDKQNPAANFDPETI